MQVSTLLQNHMQYLYGAEWEIYRDWVAYQYQNPGKPCSYQLFVWSSLPGVGKTILDTVSFAGIKTPLVIYVPYEPIILPNTQNVCVHSNHKPPKNFKITRKDGTLCKMVVLECISTPKSPEYYAKFIEIFQKRKKITNYFLSVKL